jgi:hypothetical protein
VDTRAGLLMAPRPEPAVSTAFLYLAIIAIWGGVLVPRLLRRSHQSSEARNLTESDAPVMSDVDAGDPDGLADAGVDEDDFPDSVDTEEITMPRSFLRGGPLWTERGGWWGSRSSSAESLGRPEGPGQAADVERNHQGMPVVTRAAAIRARRRSLTTLVTLVLAALALTGGGLAPGWLLVPPVCMLGGFLLLLREAAQCDRELAEARAEARAAQAARAARASRQRNRVAAERASEHVERNAEIIDISARVGDQLYDQYEDAAVRAVGD